MTYGGPEYTVLVRSMSAQSDIGWVLSCDKMELPVITVNCEFDDVHQLLYH